MKGWYKTSDEYGFKHCFERNYNIGLNGRRITELVIPDGVKQIWCISNNLTELIIPSSVELIDCRYNKLTELIVPDNCMVFCDDTVKVITRTMYNRSNRLKAILK
jgi:hypothetical protein